MKRSMIVLLLLILTAPGVFALSDISFGPYYGMAIPVVNDGAKSGALYGAQAKVSLLPFFSAGLHYSGRTYGNPSMVFFEGQPNEVELEVDGGSVSSFGADIYLGKGGSMPGLNLFLLGSLSTFKWQRDGFDDVSQTALLTGLGAELILPMKLGIEVRGMLEIASAGNGGTYKALLWFVGINYHISLGPMQGGER